MTVFGLGIETSCDETSVAIVEDGHPNGKGLPPKGFTSLRDDEFSGASTHIHDQDAAFRRGDGQEDALGDEARFLITGNQGDVYVKVIVCPLNKFGSITGRA